MEKYFLAIDCLQSYDIARCRALLQYQKDSGIVFFNLPFVRQKKQLELVGLQLFVMPTARYGAMSCVSQKYNALVATASGLFHLKGFFAAADNHAVDLSSATVSCTERRKRCVQ